jgi:hypothetical protein
MLYLRQKVFFLSQIRAVNLADISTPKLTAPINFVKWLNIAHEHQNVLAPVPNIFNNNNNNGRQKTDANNKNDDNDNKDIIKINHFTFTKKIKLSTVVTTLLIATLLMSISAISMPSYVYGQTTTAAKNTSR